MKKYSLRKGDKGQEVARLQLKLGRLTVDGDFGSKTEGMVKNHQQTWGLTIDGIAGVQTLTGLGINVIPGIDLSRHNGTVDFATVAAAGVEYAWVKLTEGTTHVNPGYEDKFKGCRDHGIPVGGYHFGRPDTNGGGLQDAKDEAHNFLDAHNKVGLCSGNLLPVLDLEAGMKTDDQLNIDWALAWLAEVECCARVRPIIYTARWYHNSYMKHASKSSLKELGKYPLWLASYNDGVDAERKVPIWDQWSVWQWTGSGTVPGVKGKCDQNWLAGGQLSDLVVS